SSAPSPRAAQAKQNEHRQELRSRSARPPDSESLDLRPRSCAPPSRLVRPESADPRPHPESAAAQATPDAPFPQPLPLPAAEQMQAGLQTPSLRLRRVRAAMTTPQVLQAGLRALPVRQRQATEES